MYLRTQPDYQWGIRIPHNRVDSPLEAFLRPKIASSSDSDITYGDNFNVGTSFDMRIVTAIDNAPAPATPYTLSDFSLADTANETNLHAFVEVDAHAGVEQGQPIYFLTLTQRTPEHAVDYTISAKCKQWP